MRRSHVLVAMTVVAALCFALPAVGATSSPLKIAKQALGLSKKAGTSASAAKKTALSARSSAKAANVKAQAALDALKKPVASAAQATRADTATKADSATTAAKADSATMAAKADSATTAGSADNVQVLPLLEAGVTGSADNTAAARAAAAEVPLATYGSFTVYAKCFTNTTSGRLFGEAYVKTSVDGAIFNSGDGEQVGPNGADFLNVLTAEADRRIQTQNVLAGDAYFSSPGEGLFDAIAADRGTRIDGHVEVGVKQGVLLGGNGPYPAGDGCLFRGVIHVG